MKSLARELEVLVALMLAALFFVPLVVALAIKTLHNGGY